MASAPPQPSRGGVQSAQHVIVYTGIAAMVGAATGAVLAVVRRQSMPVYVVGMFVNYGVFGGLFFTARETMMTAGPGLPRMSSAVAGSISGGLLTSLHAGPVRGLQGAVAWGFFGFCGQLAVESFDAARARQQAAALRRALGEDDGEGPAKSVLLGEEARAEAERLSDRSDKEAGTIGQWLAGRLLGAQEGDIGSSTAMAWLPDWVPVKIESREQAEARLKARLAEIDLLLSRDDAAKRIMEAAGETMPDDERV
ncbi:hypothetical protein FNF27_01844 [Cafeteria roenbergensis]|uniref:Uncharacterized protein n=1 Tax=Cafeteria roenbergensis TaxID=33653 RepID=A0A5A8CXC7_CAFRO|nr:hypothetical protein FNF29_00526 [Cafeteria roenbergensis]KAA0167941.1 hypothetical protein FNF28_02687 [Cafeteria roenbergensis]KAA0169016.1 hypothetical protein FNF31_00176 [Cafeteria roenbergensis]KAA0176563.1 hypothetical protein FNF27_01844 [Cafeteria roenbergensis]|eukprot:KAA0157174.1 hypothetical protein FNF29_00526 [Cafeteria roenbergensis]